MDDSSIPLNLEMIRIFQKIYSIYTETKKFSNTLQIRIFITEIHVEITQTE